VSEGTWGGYAQQDDQNAAKPERTLEMSQNPMIDLLKPRTWMHAFLRLFFQHLYTTLAWSYDFVAYVTSAGQWQTWQEAAIECLPPGRVLEIGFGTGHLLTSLSEKGYAIVGIDPSKEMARIASGRFEKLALFARLVQAKAQALPFKNNEFHSILSTFPSEYIYDPFTIQEAWRVLKPEGVFVIIPGVEEILGFKSENKGLLSLLDTFASTLYRITGEAIDPDTQLAKEFMKRLSDPGFSWDIQHVQQPRAVVLRIIAKKKG
jgi:ubiquinone/menaquinone biosynthesis C-methylase UbiE